MTSLFPLEELRTIPGFQNARFLDSYAGGQGNSVRYMSVGDCDENLLAEGFSNLFLAGEKSGFYVGHTEAITTGSLAGYNAAMKAMGRELLTLPRNLACGELLAYSRKALEEEDGLSRRFTFAGGEFLEHMKKQGLYRQNPAEIAAAVETAGLSGIYNRHPSVIK